MLFVLWCISLFGLSYLIARSASIYAETAPVVAFSSGMAVLYIASLLGQLPIAMLTLTGVGLAASVPASLSVVRNFRTDSTRWPGFIAAAGLLAFFYFKWVPNYVFVSWDEFSHWGLITKYITITDQIQTADSPIRFKTYVPGTALLQYWLTRTTGWLEAYAALAHAAFMVSAMLAMAGPVLRRDPISGVLVFIGIYVTLGWYRYEIYELMVDGTLGLLLGALIVVALTERTPRSVALASLPIAVALVLTKHTGLALAALGAVCVILAPQLRSLDPLSAFAIERRPRWKEAIGLACVPLAAGIAFLSWRIYGNTIGYSERIDLSGAFLQVVDGVLGQPNERLLETLVEYKRRFFIGQLPLKIAPVYLVAGLAAVGALIYMLARRKDRLVWMLAALLLVGGFVAYQFLLFLTYLYWFYEYEGPRLAAYERYTGTYFLAWTTVVLTMLILMIQVREKRWLGAATALTVVAVLSVGAVRQLHDTFISPVPETTRGPILDIAERTRKVAEPGDQIYFVHQSDNGLLFFLFNYEVLPHQLQPQCWQIGRQSPPGIPWACDVDLPKALQGYNLLVIVESDETLWKRYGEFFAESDRGVASGIFRIETDENGRLKLRRVS